MAIEVIVLITTLISTIITHEVDIVAEDEAKIHELEQDAIFHVRRGYHIGSCTLLSDDRRESILIKEL